MKLSSECPIPKKEICQVENENIIYTQIEASMKLSATRIPFWEKYVHLLVKATGEQRSRYRILKNWSDE